MTHFTKHKILAGLAALLMGGSTLGPGVATAQENEPGAEVLTRGPVHEAFAGTVSFDPEAGIIIDREPPVLIEEVPPEQELEGENVTWIPGYWAWDEDRNDFLWISGIWRNLPPGREWVPGYWAETEGKYQWTSGYWEDAETSEVTYLPEPPKSVETGPNVEATSNDQTWVPGNWVYREEHYAWRPGYWVAARANWVWIPAYYRWTLRGYVYVDGYWDYPVVRRGVVFAPVYFERAYYSRPNYYYTPATVIALSVFTNHLFLRPHYHHYYFGDYYEPRYRDRGYFASYSYNTSRRGYDPIYSYQRWEHRSDRDWDRSRREYYEYRRDHEDARPPRTWAALSSRSDDDRRREDFGVADRFDRVVGSRGDGRQNFKKVEKSDRDRLVAKRQEIRKYSKEREQLETRAGTRVAEGDKKTVQASKVKIDRSPVVSKKSAKSDKGGGPPARLQPRAAETAATADIAGKVGERGKPGKTDRGEPGMEKKKQDPAADRKGDPRTPDNKATETEPRTKPGERRDSGAAKKDKAKPGEKGHENATPDRKDKLAEKRQVDPTPDHKEKPQTDPAPELKEKPQVDPTPERKEKPQTDPTPERKEERQVDPTPERKEKPQAGPERKAKPAEDKKRQIEPGPEKKAKPQVDPNPVQKERRRIDLTPERKAKPQVDPSSLERKLKTPDRGQSPARIKAPEKRESTQVPPSKVERAPSRQVAPPRPEQKAVKAAEPRQAPRKVAPAPPKPQAERSQPQKTKPATRTESAKKDDDADKKKR